MGLAEAEVHMFTAWGSTRGWVLRCRVVFYMGAARGWVGAVKK